MADDDIDRVADLAEMERLANQRPYTDEVAHQLQGMVENHEARKAEEATITAAQARDLLDQAARNGIKRGIRLVDGRDGLQYERVDDDEPLGPANLPNHSLEQALALACMRYDALEEQRRERLRALYPPRRLGETHLTDAALHQLLGVPDGLRIVGVRRDEQLRTLVVTLEGEDLRQVAEGCQPPVLAGRWDYTHVELPAGGEHDEEQTLSFGRLDWWADQ